MSGQSSLQAAADFIAAEADMLDHGRYAEWLALWSDAGHYVIPIGDGDDFEDRLNYAYDDAAMRRMRVARLTSGQSMSANEAARTMRLVGRFVLLPDSADDILSVRCGQHLTEYRRGTMRTYASINTFRLRRSADTFLIEHKIVRLINSEGALAGLTYLL